MKNKFIMDITEANEITNNWGKYLEHCFGWLNYLFFGYLPNSLLPYPKAKLEKALSIMDKHYFDVGNKRGQELVRETSMLLELFHNDEEAIKKAGEKFNNPTVRKKLISAIKQHQRDLVKIRLKHDKKKT